MIAMLRSVTAAKGRGRAEVAGRASQELFAARTALDLRMPVRSRDAVIAATCDFVPSAAGRRMPLKLTHPQERRAGRPTMAS